LLNPRRGQQTLYRRNEDLLIKITSEQQEQCKVRSGTNTPCLRPAIVKVRGIPFCGPCAREQEAYFAIGELTEAPEGLRGLRQGPLVELLNRMRRTTRRHRGSAISRSRSALPS
jgi:hypothetical protein